MSNEEPVWHPETMREKRIQALVDWAKKTHHESMDALVPEARRRYPGVSAPTRHSYAEAAFFILKELPQKS